MAKRVIRVKNQYFYLCGSWLTESLTLMVSYTGGPGEEQKEGCVMVEFDDGDRGWISLPNIRLLPPGYQIYCKFTPIQGQSRHKFFYQNMS